MRKFTRALKIHKWFWNDTRTMKIAAENTCTKHHFKEPKATQGRREKRKHLIKLAIFNISAFTNMKALLAQGF